MRLPRGLLLDYGDTILHDAGMQLAAGVKRLLELAEARPPGATASEMMKHVERLRVDWHARGETSLLEGPFAPMLRNLADRLGLVYERPMAELELEFWRAAVHLQPAPGVADALALAEKLGVPVGVVSNTIFTAEPLWFEARRHGLDRHFSFIISSTDYGMRKPHPELLATAAARIGAPAETLWFIGDTLGTDVAGAQAAGMTAIWYNPWRQPRDEAFEPTIEVHHWDEIAALLRHAAAGD